MRIVLIGYLMIFSHVLLFGQSDTVYMDSDWKISKKGYDYYMVIKQKNQQNNEYTFFDYNSSGEEYGRGTAIGEDVKLRTGKFIYYHSNDTIRAIGTYINGIKNGLWTHNYENGKPKFFINYQNGIRHGITMFYYDSGEKHILLKYKKGKLKSTKIWNKKGEIIDEPECEHHMPILGEVENFDKNVLTDYIAKNIVYPNNSNEKKNRGKVYVRFKVDELGNVVAVNAINAPNKELADAAIETIKKLPKWSPGMQFGIPVKVTFTIPIYYK